MSAIIFTSDILSYNISFFRESYLTVSPSNKGADLPILGIVGAKIDYHTIKLDKMYKVLAINRHTRSVKMEKILINHPKKDITDSKTLETSESLNAG